VRLPRHLAERRAGPRHGRRYEFHVPRRTWVLLHQGDDLDDRVGIGNGGGVLQPSDQPDERDVERSAWVGRHEGAVIAPTSSFPRRTAPGQDAGLFEGRVRRKRETGEASGTGSERETVSREPANERGHATGWVSLVRSLVARGFAF